MSRRSDPKFFTKNGRLAVLSTGSDACTEHEVGIARLLEKLSGKGQLRGRDEYGLLKRKGGISSYPDIVSFRRVLVANSVRRETIQTGNEQVLAVGSTNRVMDTHSIRDEMAAEWCESDFLFVAKVGSKEADLLEQFYQLSQAGRLVISGDAACAIAGNGQYFSGIIFCDAQMIPAGVLEKVQKDYEDECRVWEESEIEAVREEVRKITSAGWSYIWPVRAQNGEIHYRINPSFELRRMFEKSKPTKWPDGTKEEFLGAIKSVVQAQSVA